MKTDTKHVFEMYNNKPYCSRWQL